MEAGAFGFLAREGPSAGRGVGLDGGMTPASEKRAFLIGHPVAHSRSPMLHGYWLRTLGLAGRYQLVDVRPEALGEFFRAFDAEGWAGGNVTVPLKTAVMPFLKRIEPDARAIGAVNTIWREDGTLVGGNSDVVGFLASLDERAPGWSDGKGRAVVLGAGGAARAVVQGLLGRGLAVTLLNRTVENAEALARNFGPKVTVAAWTNAGAALAGADLLVNTTSLGMAGKPALEIDLRPLPPTAVVCDIVYVPLETRLLSAAAARGLRCVDGLGMLLHQGVMGFEKWFGVRPAVTAELRALIEADIRAKT